MPLLRPPRAGAQSGSFSPDPATTSPIERRLACAIPGRGDQKAGRAELAIATAPSAADIAVSGAPPSESRRLICMCVAGPHASHGPHRQADGQVGRSGDRCHQPLRWLLLLMARTGGLRRWPRGIHRSGRAQGRLGCFRGRLPSVCLAPRYGILRHRSANGARFAFLSVALITTRAEDGHACQHPRALRPIVAVKARLSGEQRAATGTGGRQLQRGCRGGCLARRVVIGQRKW
jgi:hypothetical protein